LADQDSLPQVLEHKLDKDRKDLFLVKQKGQEKAEWVSLESLDEETKKKALDKKKARKSLFSCFSTHRFKSQQKSSREKNACFWKEDF